MQAFARTTLRRTPYTWAQSKQAWVRPNSLATNLCFARSLATAAPQAVVVSPHQLGAAETAKKEDEGHSDWYYVSWGSLFLFLVGGPFYFVYLLKEDDELRIFADEHFPAVVQAVKGIVNVDEVRFDPHYQNVDQFGAGTFGVNYVIIGCKTLLKETQTKL